mgnify:FL=1
MVKFETGETVRVGKKKRVGNIVYFKKPSIVYISFGNERWSFVPVQNLHKITEYVKNPRTASRHKEKRR